MDWSLFFTSYDVYPTGYWFSLFGPLHLGWLAGIGVATVLCCLWYRRQTPVRRSRFLKVIVALMVIQEVLKDILIIWTGTRFVEHFPFHLCGLALFVYPLAAFRPTAFNREFVYCLSLPGAMAALLFCDWTSCPPLSFTNWHSFTYHGYLVIFAAVLLTSGELRPNWRLLPKCFLWLAAIAAPMFFFNKFFDTNYLFLNVPSPGSPLVFLEQIFGNPGYIFGTALLLLAVWVFMYLPWAFAARRSLVRSRVAETDEVVA